MENIDYLYEAAVFYKDNLENRRFNISITRRNKNLSLELLFLPQHFYHLIGLHKLTDLPYLKRSSSNVYKEILLKKLTYPRIAKSEHIDEILNRLINYKEMLNILNADSLFFKSLHGKFKGIDSDCVLTRMISQAPLFSFLFLVNNKNVYFPRSFFTRNEQYEYTKEGTHWKIVSIEEMPRN